LNVNRSEIGKKETKMRKMESSEEKERVEGKGVFRKKFKRKLKKGEKSVQ